MQKKIIALAVAGLASTAAFAQSNVTIYGIADVGIAQVRSNGSLTSTQVVSGGLSTSRIGFKGVEDLGNGLKALFTLEYRLDMDKNTTIGGNFANGTTNASGPARQQFVGLTGGFGTAVAGRLQTTAFDWQGKYITLAATAFDGYNKMTGAYRINLSNDSRAENAVAYISPSMGGVTVALNHAFALEQGASATANNYSATLVGVYYDNGPLSVGFVGEKLQGGGASEAVEATDLALGASYDFKVVKLTGTYQTTKNNATSGVAAKFNSIYHLGAQIPVSAKGTVHVQWAQNNAKTTLGDDNGKGLSVAYTHALSKRTTAYAGIGYLDNSGNGSSYSYGVSRAEGSSNIIAAGLRHAF
ncbi:MAG: ompC [Rhodocyclaceae bacterium]|nr:MAG: ompC [Rhodocyclaceae bacterium]